MNINKVVGLAITEDGKKGNFLVKIVQLESVLVGDQPT